MEDTFSLFYDQHAPKLWGLIVQARLSTQESEAILEKTFLRAWHDPNRLKITDKKVLPWLLFLAYSAGLYYNDLQPFMSYGHGVFLRHRAL
jgi:DNA-directed RNA polymerase specialized sigma24 family protein